jgi:hypothetical protein
MKIAMELGAESLHAVSKAGAALINTSPSGSTTLSQEPLALSYS